MHPASIFRPLSTSVSRAFQMPGLVLVPLSLQSDRTRIARADRRSLQANGALVVRCQKLAVLGFHYGPVISQGSDVFGDAVNVAARVVAHAKPGQIFLTQETARELPKVVEANVRFVGSTQVKGKTEPVDLFEVIWDRENLTQARSVIEVRSEDAQL